LFTTSRLHLAQGEIATAYIMRLPRVEMLTVKRSLVLLAMLTLCGNVRASFDPTDPFLPYLFSKPPAIVSKLDEESIGTVHLQRVVFRSRVIRTTQGPQPSDVFAIIASPLAPGKYPGLLILHGGRGAAEQQKAIAWAARGYVVVAPDLPGIADPELIPYSSGPWKGDFTSKYITANPDVTASPIFDGVLAALQALELLRSQPNVRIDRIGVTGIAWGGYVATMVSGIAGKNVRATFSVYGSGYYDRGSAWQERLAQLPKSEAARWLEHLDAGRRAQRIAANYFVAAATNHQYYWPPAVMATLAEIPGPSNQLFAPNAVDSISLPGGSVMTEFPSSWLRMEETYFAFHLQSLGSPFPIVAIEKAARRENETVRVQFSVVGPPVRATAYYSLNDRPWVTREWVEVPVVARRNGRYEAIIPAAAAVQGASWLALASDARPVTVSSLIATVPNP
jgi:dienelactone hydrolase